MKEPTGKSKSHESGDKRPRRDDTERRTAHVEYLARKLGGGAQPTPELYARVARQWQNLPGAVRSMAPPNLTTATKPPNPTDTNRAPAVPAPLGKGQGR